MESAVRHCAAGASIWEWASTDRGRDPHLVLACAGDVPTLEVLAATMLLREALPDLRVRVVNVVDLMTLQPSSEHPHGLADDDFDALFTTNRPVVFAYHGYPWLIHRLTYRRHNHDNIHVRGYKEEGTTTTPFDMVVRNNMDRYQLAIDSLARLPEWKTKGDDVVRRLREKLELHGTYVREHGEDMPEVRDWRWRA
jgi:xylulose-5-phosphate/fructose-6-phosphate phosphoketolase